jgi:hypothetical protein
MTSIVYPPKTKVKAKNFERDLLAEFSSRFRLRTNLWLTLTSGYCPKAYRTERQMKVLEMQEKAMERVDKSLDISRSMTLQEDVQLLLESLFIPKQLWLFRAHRRR